MKRFLQQSLTLLALFAVSSCGGRSTSVPTIRNYQGSPPPAKITPQSLCIWSNGRWVCSGGGSTTKDPCDITWQTYATSPVNRSRTILGVEEQVALTTTTGTFWSISTNNGSTLSGSSGQSVTLTAGNAAGSATIKLSGGARCTTSEVSFQIIAPSVTSYYPASKRHDQGYADVGALANVYVGPDTVSFENIWWDEAQAYFSASGVWYSCSNGKPHEPGPTAVKVGSEVPGYGSELTGFQDLEDTGACTTGNQLAGGSESVTIPTQWQTYGSAWNLIQNVQQTASANTSGAATLTKDHVTESANLNDARVGE